jgi:hypothetical protein
MSTLAKICFKLHNLSGPVTNVQLLSQGRLHSNHNIISPLRMWFLFLVKMIKIFTASKLVSIHKKMQALKNASFEK